MVPAPPQVLAADDAAAHFARHGWALTAPLAPEIGSRLSEWVDEVSAWPDDGGEWLQHREATEAGAVLCRSENFVPFHVGLRTLLTRGPLLALASSLLGEPAVLYKEKINHKAPGGGGFAPHQDAPAYRFVDVHVSCMIAVDDADLDNGCLEVVAGAHHDLLPTDDAGCIRPDVAASLDWQAVEVQAGQVLWFHSRTPHRSAENRSVRPRRALYPTYNAAAEGDLRAAYYRQKRTELATSVGAAPISLIGDFQGTVVS